VGPCRIQYVPLVVLIVGAVAAAVVVALAYKRQWRWTGLPADPGDEKARRPPSPAKTLWDWLQLFVVPLVLAVAAFALNASQQSRQQRQEDKRAASERARAEDSAREQTLRDYVQQMSQLMLDTPLGAHGAQRRRSSTADRTALLVARTVTLTTLRRLDGARKGLVVEFLIGSGLITTTVRYVQTFRPVRRDELSVSSPRLSLRGADLSHVVMPQRGLTGAGAAVSNVRVVEWLTSISLRRANLRNAHFLRASNWVGIDLDRADMTGADLSGTNLAAANLGGACLSDAVFARATLGQWTFWPPATIDGVRGRRVSFTQSHLEKVNFSNAILSGVDLRGASTGGARGIRALTVDNKTHAQNTKSGC